MHVDGDDGIFITKIIPGGAAAAEGTLSVGDRVIKASHSYPSPLTHKLCFFTRAPSPHPLPTRWMSTPWLASSTVRQCPSSRARRDAWCCSWRRGHFRAWASPQSPPPPQCSRRSNQMGRPPSLLTCRSELWHNRCNWVILPFLLLPAC